VYPRIKNPTWIQNNSNHIDRSQTYLIFLRLLSEWLPNVSLPMSTHQTFFRSISLLTVHIIVLKQQFCLSTTLWSAPLMTAKCCLISVRHLTLLLSLLSRRFCVRDTTHDWFRSYLSCRTQSFTFAGQQTGLYPLDCSILQGSVLAPLKFIAYTENGVDTIKQHNVNVHLYADDTQLYACCHPHNTVDTRQRISRCTADFSTW